jgi:hypothetical protein
MIFSFPGKNSPKIDFEILQTDIFCLFAIENTIKLPSEAWLNSIVCSLKMKTNVLVLEEHLAQPPMLNITQRWQVGDDFLWLAPRSLSVLLEAPHDISNSYNSLKNYLKSTK